MSKPNHKQNLLNLLMGLGCENIPLFMTRATPEAATELGKYIAAGIKAQACEIKQLKEKLGADRKE